MSTSNALLGVRLPVWLLTASVLASATALPAQALPQTQIIPLADMLRGIETTPAQCSTIPTAVWVSVMGRGFCMRYYLSTAGGEGTRPVVFLQGDKLGRLNPRTREFEPGPRAKDVDTDDLVRFADSLSRQSKTTAMYLARVGVDGSSGDHRIRHSMLELKITNAALDTIKQRHGFDGFHLVGQSGGSKLIGGMLALRTDVGCAVIGSGRLANARPSRPSPNPATDFFDVADAIPAIMQRRSTRILVVTDPEDKKVPEAQQTGFVRRMRQAGGQVEQYMVQATDDDRHGVVGYARAAATACMRGASEQDIEARLKTLVERRLAAKAKADAKANADNDANPAASAQQGGATTGSGGSAPHHIR